MPEPMDDNELRKYIEAFADGELDVETNLRVLERMAMSPEATRRVVHQQELRRLVDRAMREQTPAVPAALRAKIEALTRESADLPDDRPAVLARIGPWALPVAVAAAVIAVVSVGVWMATRPGPANSTPPIARSTPHPFEQGAPVFAANLIEEQRKSKMGSRHENCSARIELLNRATEFTTVVTEIPHKVETFLGPETSMPLLDLSGVGYEFSGAGACGLPGGKAVHLVYKPVASSGRTDSMSLWIRADAGQTVSVEEGKLYTATPDGAAHPILVWRRGNSVYYLVGEATSRMLDAARALYPVK